MNNQNKTLYIILGIFICLFAAILGGKNGIQISLIVMIIVFILYLSFRII